MLKVNRKRKKYYLWILIIIIILILGFMIGFKVKNKKSINILNLNFKNRVQELSEFNSGKYYKIGWLQVQGTNIDVPILDSTSNEDNLDYSFGWRSPNYITGENREVLLGHNILNVSSSPISSNENLQDFESLMSFSYYDFAKNNLYIQYTKDGKEELYLIYAIGFYDYNYDNSESFSDSEKVKEYIKKVRNNSLYDYDIKVDENDELLTLKTCTRYFGTNEKQQFIVDARKLRKGEQTVKYSVKTTPIFNELITSSQKFD